MIKAHPKNHISGTFEAVSAQSKGYTTIRQTKQKLSKQQYKNSFFGQRGNGDSFLKLERCSFG